jgi:methylenetetrahydrofolate reductase (NADPH)
MSNLQSVLAGGHFAVTAELGPPKGVSPENVRKKTELLKGAVDAANITDNQTAVVRMSSIAAAHIVLSGGLEPVMQMVTRDRNRIALQSDIIGAAALGIRNVLCLAGDHQKFGNHPGAKNVYDIDSIQLVQIFRIMRDEKKFACGDAMKNSPELFLGAAANPFSSHAGNYDPLELEVMRLAKKVLAGADFIQTQAIFDLPRFREFMKRVCEKGLHEKTAILAGVVPLKSVKAALHMKQNVAGMMVPDSVIKRMEKAADAREEGITLSVETIEELRTVPGIKGIHIMAIEWEEKVSEIVRKSGLFPRPSLQAEHEGRGH